VAYIYHRALFSYKEELNFVIYRKLNGTGDKNKPDLERQMYHVFSHMQNLD
jgi:hypothetical protein